MNDILFSLARDFALSFVVAICWGILFGSSKRILWVAGLLGGFGHSLRFLLLYAGVGLVSSTLIASVLIGLAGIFFAHRVHHPPVVFTMPACITMIPGLYAYRTVLNGIKLVDMQTRNPDAVHDMMQNLMLSLSLLFTLAIGISIGVLLFRKRSTKDIAFGKRLKVED